MDPDEIITIQEIIFLTVFFLLVFAVPALAVWASYSPSSPFDMSSVWTHQGRIDKFAIIIMGTWWVHTCSMILWTLLRTIQTQDYATYMGWAIPIIAKMWLSPSGESPPIQTLPPDDKSGDPKPLA